MWTYRFLTEKLGLQREDIVQPKESQSVSVSQPIGVGCVLHVSRIGTVGAIHRSQGQVTRPRAAYGNDLLRPLILIGKQRQDMNDHNDHNDPADHGETFSQISVAGPARGRAEKHQEIEGRLYRRFQGRSAA